MLQKLYQWTLRLAGHRRCGAALAGVGFAESSVFPIPPDALLIPMIYARPDKAWYYAAICTLSSVAGGLFGYVVGAVFFEAVARPLIDFYGYGLDFQTFENLYHQYGAWIVIIGGFTPIPFKVVTLASGAVGLDWFIFLVASLLSRGGRFFLVAGLFWKFGPPIRLLLERHLGWFTALFGLLLVGGILVVGVVLK